MSGDADGWVFDDEFIRSGQYEPPARTRAAIARHGGVRTSWRQPGVPLGADPATRRAGDGTACDPSRLSRATRWIAALLAVCAAVLIAFRWSGHGVDSDGRAMAPVLPRDLRASAVPDPTHPASQVPQPSETDADVVHGISPTTAVGTCLLRTSDPDPDPSQPLNLRSVDCATAHEYELVSLRRAAGASTSYPVESYWLSAVTTSCQQDYIGYSGHPASELIEAGGRISFFRPTTLGWSFGDRTVYCLAEWPRPHLGSVR